MKDSRSIITAKTLNGFLSGDVHERPFKGELDNYMDIVVKLIPHEIVAAYLCAYAIITSVDMQIKKLLLAFIFVSCLVLTPVYTRLLLKVKVKGQVVLSTLAFIPWALSIGSVFDLYVDGIRIIGAISLIIFSLIPPLVFTDRK